MADDRGRDDAHPDELDDEDDDALSWEGDEELGRATSLTGAGPARTVPQSRAAQERERADAELAAGVLTASAGPRVVADRPRDVPRLVATVLFALVYVAYEVTWILTIQGAGGAIASSSGGGLLDVIASMSQFLALLAAALWFVVVVHLTRGSARRWRLGWLALGLLVLLPWPYLSGFVR